MTPIDKLTAEAIEWMERGAREHDRWVEQARRDEQQRSHRRRLERVRELPLTEADIARLMSGDYENTRCVRAVRRWLETPAPILMLCGDRGRGKTFAAAVAIAQHRDALYFGAREIERVFAARYGDEQTEQDRACRCRLLIVDDLGRERDAAGMTMALLDLVDDRRKHGRRTVFASNLGKQQILDRYSDPRLVSRLAEPGIALWLVDTGEDLRRRDL